jgi:hypothetical protein
VATTCEKDNEKLVSENGKLLNQKLENFIFKTGHYTELIKPRH